MESGSRDGQFPGPIDRVHHAAQDRQQKADDLYRWVLPLLRMDTVNKFVQLIKLAQEEVGMGSERVRPPRLTLAGAERRAALKTIKSALTKRPKL